MKIESMIIAGLRNHEFTELEFSKGINVLQGLNGAGKTTVLEAIALCSFSKSFLPVLDASLINVNSNGYSVNCSATSDLGMPYKLSIKYSQGVGKKISSSIGDNLLPKDIIGEMPLAVLSPDYKAITFGSPQDRRSFIDSILSQSGKKYIELILTMKKCLKQRNALLAAAKKDYHFDYSVIEPWTNIFIDVSADIILRRYNFINEFKTFFAKSYLELVGDKEIVDISYRPNSVDIGPASTKESIKNELFEVYSKIKIGEYKRGSSLFGPQKDDFPITINSGIAKETASQGQHKSLLISLKFAEFEFLKEYSNELPIILLDDIFSELDDERSEKALSLIRRANAQTFITVTNVDKIKDFIKNEDEFQIFFVNSGKCEYIY